MKISNIKKYKNKYVVKLSDNTSLNFYEDTIIKFNLLKPRNITEDELNEMIDYNNVNEALSVALKYLSSKMRSRKEIEDKLKKYDLETINKVLPKLDSLGLLNEDKYIEAYIHDKINLTLKGPNVIRNELRKLNVNLDKVDKYLSEVSDKEWESRIDSIINKKINANHNLSSQMLKIKIKRDLISYGYSDNLISFSLNHLNIEESEYVLEKEFNKLLKKLDKIENNEEKYNKLKYGLYKKGFKMENIEKIINKD